MSIVFLLVTGIALLSYLTNVIVSPDDDEEDDDDGDRAQQCEAAGGLTPVKSTREAVAQKFQKTVEKMMDSLTLLYDTAGVKLFILFVTAQVLYQFTNVTSASSEPDDVEYPEPAASFVGGLGFFNLEMLSYVPAECIFEQTDFYTALTL
jgi:hypothetical protein